MSFVISSSSTTKNIVEILDSLTESYKKEFLRQLKLKRAKTLANKMQQSSNPDFSLTDDEIGEIVHQHRMKAK
ncbi:MAG: hypothetical protein RL708_585 [Bacteroidota bacterium]|jgi:hypothetical protein